MAIRIIRAKGATSLWLGQKTKRNAGGESMNVDAAFSECDGRAGIGGGH
jgi:hypothetical protein